MKQAHEIIIKPIISEQSLREAQGGRYTFMVERHASKDEIKKALEDMFGVSVKKVMTNIIKGTKTKLTKRRKIISDISYKKARINVLEGQKIDIFDEHIEEKK